jgi:Xaa-Pro aminopeptidase
LHHFERLAPIIHNLRRTKEEAELQQIKKAIDITRKGFLNSLKVIEPGKREFEIEAEITAEFIRNGANGHGFLPIVASGANACVLHYINNDSICNDGDLVLMDIGAEYNYYNADITRTVPVNGRFTNRQRQVYEAVYRLHNNILSMIKPGISIEMLNQQTIPFIEKELIDLKLLTTAEIKKQLPEKQLYRKYLMHGVSHSLGIDVHDPNNKHDILEEGMVITCEPGLYIAEENIGIRLENDILVTPNGCINLSADIPIEPEAIESMMQ